MKNLFFCVFGVLAVVLCEKTDDSIYTSTVNGMETENFYTHNTFTRINNSYQAEQK